MAPPVQRIEDSFVFCDVLRCSGDGGTVTELNEPRRLEHEERAAAVGRIVRDSYTGAVGKIFQVFNLLRRRTSVPDGSLLRKRVSDFLTGRIHPGTVCAGSSSRQGFIVQCQVRLYVIGKFDDFHIDAFFGKLILHGAEDFSVGTGIRPL